MSKDMFKTSTKKLWIVSISALSRIDTESWKRKNQLLLAMLKCSVSSLSGSIQIRKDTGARIASSHQTPSSLTQSMTITANGVRVEPIKMFFTLAETAIFSSLTRKRLLANEWLLESLTWTSACKYCSKTGKRAVVKYLEIRMRTVTLIGSLRKPSCMIISSMAILRWRIPLVCSSTFWMLYQP